MKRLSFWLFVIGSAALFAYVLDSVFLASPKFQSEPQNFAHEAPGQPILSTLKMPRNQNPPGPSYTNEEIERDIQNQSSQMGIKEIAAPHAPNDTRADGTFPGPFGYQKEDDKSVYLEGKTPALLKKADASSAEQR